MAHTSPIGAIGTESKGSSKTLSFSIGSQNKKENEKPGYEKVAYASSVLPHLLNGSAHGPQQTASAFQA